MGSIELFPRKPSVRPVPESWRITAGVVRVREARLEDYAAIRALQKIAAQRPAWSLKQFESRLHVFGMGQLVAARDGCVVGAASTLMVGWEPDAAPAYRDLTADDSFLSHDAAGETLFGAEVVVYPSHHGFAASRALFQARRRLCRRLNLRRILTTAPLEGYARFREKITPEAFAMRVVGGDVPDANIRFLMAQGFQFCGVLHDYAPEHAASCGHAALFAWLNPLYAPPRPPAFAESQGARKCA
jgi:GNAT superfamily N-acetyltransferase